MKKEKCKQAILTESYTYNIHPCIKTYTRYTYIVRQVHINQQCQQKWKKKEKKKLHFKYHKNGFFFLYRIALLLTLMSV